MPSPLDLNVVDLARCPTGQFLGRNRSGGPCPGLSGDINKWSAFDTPLSTDSSASGWTYPCEADERAADFVRGRVSAFPLAIKNRNASLFQLLQISENLFILDHASLLCLRPIA